MSQNEQAKATNRWPKLPSRIELKCELKRGGMGAVYAAYDKVLKLHVAVKVNLRPEPAMRAAFEREAQFLAYFRHPSLPRCLDLHTAGGVQFFIMDLIEGDDLSTVMAKRPKELGSLPTESVLNWARQLLDVLDYLHGQGVVHGDLKTANIKVNNDRVYLLDLGLAYGLSGEMDTLKHGEDDYSGHSPGYSPPEQSRIEEMRPASDFYALGATLYKLLTTHTPPAAEKRRRDIDSGQPDPLKDIRFYNPGLDEHVSLEINRALSLDVRRRPQSAAEMARMMFPEPPAPAPAPLPVPVRSRAWSHPLRLLETLLLIALPVCALIYAARGMEIFLSDTSTVLTEPVRELSPAEQAAEWTEEAEHLRLSGRRKEALALVNESFALNPNDPYVWFVRLALWCDSDEAAESGAHQSEVLEEARRIVKALPSPSKREEYMALAQAHMALAQAHMELSNLEQAQAAAEKAAGPKRDFGPALLISAWAGFQKEVRSVGKKGKDVLAVADRSLADCDAAIEDMRDYPQAYLIRADIHTSMLSPARARRDLLRVLEIAPRPIYYVMLGEVYAALNDFDAARENYNKALADNRKLRPAFLGLAALHEKAEDWLAVVQQYLAANGIRETADTFKRLGYAYKQLGQTHLPDAIASYEKALNLAPNDAKALAALEELRTMVTPEADEQPTP